MIYYYHGAIETYHPKLGTLKPGANEIPEDLLDEAEEARAAGLLSHDEHPTEYPPAHTMDDEGATDDSHEPEMERPEA